MVLEDHNPRPSTNCIYSLRRLKLDEYPANTRFVLFLYLDYLFLPCTYPIILLLSYRPSELRSRLMSTGQLDACQLTEL